MFIRTSSLLFPIVALAAVATAAPGALEARTDSNCNTGSAQCCNNTYTSTDTSLALLTGLLGIVLPSVSGLVGLGCTSIIGSAAPCTQQPVCCTGNTFNGLINVGCSPINVVL
ncbi:hydrophobin [Melanogaster broomeanus]|nr:hydrophobin [Melanogaster broomeanus]